MIGYIRGPVTRIFHEYCFIDVHGVGYRIYAPAATLAALVPERETTLFTYTVSYTHLRAHETKANLVCRLLLEKKNTSPSPRD